MSWVENTGLKEEDKGEKQRRRGRVTDLIWQKLKSESSLGCQAHAQSHACTHTQAHTPSYAVSTVCVCVCVCEYKLWSRCDRSMLRATERCRPSDIQLLKNSITLCCSLHELLRADSQTWSSDTVSAGDAVHG